MDPVLPTPPPARASPREWLVALLCALALAAIPLREGLLDGERVLFGVDTATAQAPWSTGPVRNPELSDQGVVFYPAYRHVSRRWRSGEWPLWNRLEYAGAPLLANPQLGVLDPQVLALVALEALGGRPWFDRGLAWLAWLRLAGAGLGAYLLARELGLARAGAALCAISFAGSAFLVVWVGHSLGHVAPLLPWVLLGVERARSLRGVAGTALALALAILGGHPETAFYCGACAGLWALSILRRDGRHGRRALAGLALGTLLGAVSLVPFVEYLAHSGARLARAAVAPRAVDLVALGALVLAVGLARDFRAQLERPAAARLSAGALGLRTLLFGALTALVAWKVEWPQSARLLFGADLFGTPALAGGWRGSGSFLESISPWLPAVTLSLALAALVTPVQAGRLRRRALVATLGVGALLCALRLPGSDELYARLPGIGRGAPVRLAVVSALGLGLLAGEALDAAPRAARVFAVLVVAACASLAAADLGRAPAQAAVELDPPDGLVEIVERPAAELGAGALTIAGWLHPAVPAGALGLRVERALAGGAWSAASAELWPARPDPELALRPGAPAGARGFRFEGLDARALAEGTWRFSVVLHDPGGVPVGERVAAALRVVRAPRMRASTLLFLAASLLAVLRLGPRAGALGRSAPVWVAALQALAFAEGQNPSVPRAEVFPPTRTEEILRRELGPGRFLSDAGILPPGTALALGLAGADGYDALDPAGFDLFRPFVVRPGSHPLLGFTASGVDLDGPALGLLGVTALASRAVIEHPDWRLVAGPHAGAPEFAEVCLHVRREPLPRAFLVGRTRSLAEVASSPERLRAAGFAPFEEALLEDPARWSPREPLRSGSVDSITWADERVEVGVTLDGEALLVLCEQAFPGWEVRVDGEPRELLTVDGIFRAVALRSGERRAVFRYRPPSVRLGAVLSGLALLAVLVCALRRP